MKKLSEREGQQRLLGGGGRRVSVTIEPKISGNFGSYLGIYTKSHAIPYLQGLEPILGVSKPVTNYVNVNSLLSNVSMRVERFALQEKAKKILTQTVQRGNKWAYVHRVNYCLRSRIDKNSDVGLMYNKERNTANYSNLQRCCNVWNCPVCSAVISEGRRAELKQGLDNWVSQGDSVYLVTFTNRHYFGDDLADLLAGQKKAFIKFWQKRAVVEMLKKIGYVGRIVATEVTWGQNGWHPHYHMVFFFDGAVDMQGLQSFLSLHWQEVCVKSGLPAPTLDRGVDVRDGTYASQYVSKWGLDCEMTKGHIKKGREGGLTPFDLLRMSDGLDKYAELFRAFADAFKGKRQLVWSDGLKERLSIEQKTDEQIISETEKKSEFVRGLSEQIWYLILNYNKRAEVLSLVEQDYIDGGRRLTEFITELSERFLFDLNT